MNETETGSLPRLVRGKLPRNCRENLLRFSLQFIRYMCEGWAEAQPCVGGDPSAGSPTDTLLRLNLPC